MFTLYIRSDNNKANRSSDKIKNDTALSFPFSVK